MRNTLLRISLMNNKYFNYKKKMNKSNNFQKTQVENQREKQKYLGIIFKIYKNLNLNLINEQRILGKTI